jgi:hypothetical protein
VGGLFELNVAVAEVAAVKSRVQLDVPLHTPDHPANVEPDLGVAFSVNEVPLEKLATQVVPQSIPEGLLVIVPDPVPTLCSAIRIWGIVGLNMAITEALEFSVNVQGVVPPQAPYHPPKVESELGVAVSVTDVPLGKSALQVAGQLIPAGLLMTVPAPAPSFCTVS